MRRQFDDRLDDRFFGLLVVLSLGIGPMAAASVDVAFIEIHRPDGSLVKLEPEGRFAHVAISFKGAWLHSHPISGVKKVGWDVLESTGSITEVLTLTSVPDLLDEDIARFLDKPYDTGYSWDDARIYCSELVAKLLNLAPEPMYFDPKLWPSDFWPLNGLPGLSPDGAYRKIRALGATVSVLQPGRERDDPSIE